MDFEKLNYLVILPRFCSKLVKRLKITYFFCEFEGFLYLFKRDIQIQWVNIVVGYLMFAESRSKIRC